MNKNELDSMMEAMGSSTTEDEAIDFYEFLNEHNCEVFFNGETVQIFYNGIEDEDGVVWNEMMANFFNENSDN